jgi:hypothetical protein
MHPLVETWHYAKTDLFHWIPVLNRFDAILERLIAHYNLPDQNSDFASQDKSLLVHILSFTRVLWENSTNRALYNSYEVCWIVAFFSPPGNAGATTAWVPRASWAAPGCSPSTRLLIIA